MTTAPQTDLHSDALAYVRECLQAEDDAVSLGDLAALHERSESEPELRAALVEAIREVCCCEGCGGDGEVWGWGRDASMGRGSECPECGGTGRAYDAPRIVRERLVDDEMMPLAAAEEAA